MTGYACGAQTYEDVRTRVRVQLCYASIFGDAPTVQELLRRSGAPTQVVEAEVDRLVSEGDARRWGDQVVLGRDSVPVRHDPEALQAALDEHRTVLSYLRRSSLVRMLAVSGSLAHARPRSGGKGTPDLDLFIVCAPSSVHLLRFFLRFSDLVRAVTHWPRKGKASRSTLCPNYVTEISYLEVSNPSLYTATDSLSVRVLKGEHVYRSFLAANRWIARYYPDSVTDAPTSEVEERAPFVRAASNLLFFGVMATASTVKSIARRSARVYSVGRQADRGITLQRTEATGGGHEPAVARRFVAAYREHFGDDPDLFGFLFPEWHDPKSRVSPPGWPELGYDA